MKGLRGTLRNALVCLAAGAAVLSCKQADRESGSATAVSAASLGPFSARLSWKANPESLVNTVGGGYRVFLSVDQDVDPGSAQVFYARYVSGPKAPTSVIIPNLTLRDGHYYTFKVQAFSANNVAGPFSAQYMFRATR